jgi:hypothetical protein
LVAGVADPARPDGAWKLPREGIDWARMSSRCGHASTGDHDKTRAPRGRGEHVRDASGNCSLESRMEREDSSGVAGGESEWATIMSHPTLELNSDVGCFRGALTTSPLRAAREARMHTPFAAPKVAQARNRPGSMP